MMIGRSSLGRKLSPLHSFASASVLPPERSGVSRRRGQETVSLPSSDGLLPLHVLSIASAVRIRWIRYLAKSPRVAVNRQMGVSLPSPMA